MDISLDTGTNLTSLGIIWLILKYLLPVLIGIILIIIGFFALGFLWNKLEDWDIPIANEARALGFLIAILIVIAVIINSI